MINLKMTVCCSRSVAFFFAARFSCVTKKPRGRDPDTQGDLVVIRKTHDGIVDAIQVRDCPLNLATPAAAPVSPGPETVLAGHPREGRLDWPRAQASRVSPISVVFTIPRTNICMKQFVQFCSSPTSQNHTNSGCFTQIWPKLHKFTKKIRES